MSPRILSSDELARALAERDLTDAAQGRHAMQRLVEETVAALRRAWRCNVHVHRGERIVNVYDNYDALGYELDAVTRDAR
jgi:phenylalanyl-tRNA synthetase alpha chain